MRYCELCGAAFRSGLVCPKDRTQLRDDIGDPLIDTVLGDRYKILDRIASGGMGQVYRAAHKRIPALYAVKVLYGELAFESTTLTRFLREAEVASCLSSRHIGRVFDFGLSNEGLPYMAMEYLDGPTLFELYKRGGPMHPKKAVRIAQGILRGLSHAHSRGIVHRDMKGENVILVHEDDEDVPKILDFGVARMRDPAAALTQAGALLGTPLYMAPEQLFGGTIDARTDLYALGAMLFEMLYGAPPFQAGELMELVMMHRSAPVPDLCEVLMARCGNADLDPVVKKLMAKKQEDRYASAREAILALEQASKEIPEEEPPEANEPQTPIELELRTRIESTIHIGAPLYNTGDHVACAALYKRTAEELLRLFSPSLAAGARLRAALLRAVARSQPMLAAWELRYAFDDLLGAPTFLVRAHAGPIERELGAFDSIAQKRESQGHVGILGDFAVEFIRSIIPMLGRHESLLPVRLELEAAVSRAEQAEAGAARYEAIKPALVATQAQFIDGAPMQAVLATFHGSEMNEPSLTPSEAPRSAVAVVADQSRLFLAEAARDGAAAFQKERFDEAARVYRKALETLSSGLRDDPAGEPFAAWLDRALKSASRKTDRDGARVLRRTILQALRRDGDTR